MERLDKFLSNNKIGTRTEVKGFMKKGLVKVNGEIVKDPAFKVNPERDKIYFEDIIVEDKKFIYLIMNKPDGVISATEDDYDRTVIDLLDGEDAAYNPFPVGRLDKDTVGLLILTNDGELNHRLISPKYHVKKTYYAKLEKAFERDYIEKFRKGVVIDGDYLCKEAELKLDDEHPNEAVLTITEGKFHQVKKMFEAVSNKVTYLKRISFGNISLPQNLEEGTYRHLTEDELNTLMDAASLSKK